MTNLETVLADNADIIREYRETFGDVGTIAIDFDGYESLVQALREAAEIFEIAKLGPSVKWRAIRWYERQEKRFAEFKKG